ncbi:hypothetical protein POM88_028561 [Heracleum sosnowskyi]|uniref:F-box domain-containing protein n=1 Tax=Heracleum sosnowskyi TaxID=360622 RepID=A0AAD8HT35_9APIA|nr:hypothetical protein POM88_028561 [Heracleum sosnowskyi]
MEERKWENLSSDFLVNIFKRLDLEILLSDVPIVCKNWYQALLDPLCWQKLVFPPAGNDSRLAIALEDGENVPTLIKFVLGRSQEHATTIVLPAFTYIVDVLNVLDQCPALKFLAVSSYTLIEASQGDYSFASRTKLKQCFKRICIRNRIYMTQITEKIRLNYKNFVGLSVTHANINQVVASAIVSNLAAIKCLVFDNSRLSKEHLEMILLE